MSVTEAAFYRQSSYELKGNKFYIMCKINITIFFKFHN